MRPSRWDLISRWFFRVCLLLYFFVLNGCPSGQILNLDAGWEINWLPDVSGDKEYGGTDGHDGGTINDNDNDQGCIGFCPVGKLHCLNSTEYQVCAEVNDSCFRWEKYACGNQADCYDALYACSKDSYNPPLDECIRPCQDECTLGQTECQDSDNYKICVIGPGNCTIWKTSSDN